MIRFVFVLTCLAAVVCAFADQMAASARAIQAEPGISAEQQLAERYAPVAQLRRQQKACDRDGEGYFPAPVEVVLGNPAVALKQATTGSSGSDPIVKTGPTAQDLAGLDDSYYLDFPGDPRRVGCGFETRFKQYAAETLAEPTTYARVVVDAEHDQVVLQFWFWYFFNDWNNTHESDWEMIQLVWDAGSVEEALNEDPARVGYAQHGGGELAEWGDEKIRLLDGHPVVYPAAGSHATHYGPDYFIGWGENGTGFGCDNASAPSRRVALNVVLLPDELDPDGQFAWLLFEGRWGERQAWEFNGPLGPNTGMKWSDPIEAMANWRDSSLDIPTSNSLGPTATDLFCLVSREGSRFVIRMGTEPLVLIATVLAILGAGIGLVMVKRQELGEAFTLFRRNARTFLAIGSVSIPIGMLFNAIMLIVRENPPAEWVMQWFNDTAGARFAIATLIGGLQYTSMLVVIAPPVIYAANELLEGRNPSAVACLREGYRYIGVLALSVLLLVAVVGGLVIFLLGIPLAIWLIVRWQFFGQATIVRGGGSSREALRLSSHAVAGHWWRALGDSLVFQLMVLLPGPLVGLLLMLGGRASVSFANSLSSLVYVVSLPLAFIGLTFAYRRYQALALEPHKESGHSLG